MLIFLPYFLDEHLSAFEIAANQNFEMHEFNFDDHIQSVHKNLQNTHLNIHTVDEAIQSCSHHNIQITDANPSNTTLHIQVTDENHQNTILNIQSLFNDHASTSQNGNQTERNVNNAEIINVLGDSQDNDLDKIVQIKVETERNQAKINELEDSEIDIVKIVQLKVDTERNQAILNGFRGNQDDIEKTHGHTGQENVRHPAMKNVSEDSQEDDTDKIVQMKVENVRNQGVFDQFGDCQDDEIDKLAEMKEEKTQKQIMAAKRSLKTNFIVAALFTVLSSVLVILPKTAKLYYSATVLSSLKTALPILTAIANFGPVKSVVCQYWKHIKEKIICK